MLDIFGKMFGGLVSLAQEKILLDFLTGHPATAGMGMGFTVIVLVILPIGPDWIRKESWIGKGIGAAGALLMVGSFIWLGFDAAAVSLERHREGHGKPPSTQSQPLSEPNRPAAPDWRQSSNPG